MKSLDEAIRKLRKMKDAKYSFVLKSEFEDRDETKLLNDAAKEYGGKVIKSGKKYILEVSEEDSRYAKMMVENTGVFKKWV